ncbi:carboxymuconolactone decarboxylase family protein [Albidovulum sediminis]|uniref:Carboxymuconolactone decarboxylase family protein n=1 Tax=Albidovulum sediminis TaxID=3066345 RepID=A0ABT2NRV7_9RHOB|nr:carboxymuconolactone decarboxylase family protein [Defluviimonas sediminis]MCT8331658.1 carboxymuconolactone decarboxylase family protein [Defluviimonas sediminis]
MSRISPVDPATATGRAKDLLDGVRKSIGMTPNLMRVMAQEPAVLDTYLQIGAALGKGSFDAPTREAIALATAGANACGYCASAHVAISKGMKVPHDEILARLGGSSSDSKLAALLAFARNIVATRGEVADADLAAVRAAGATDGEIVETVANVVANILTNYINHVARTEIDFPQIDPSVHRVG